MFILLSLLTSLAFASNPLSFKGGGIGDSRTAETALRWALTKVNCAALLAYGEPEGLAVLRERLAARHGGPVTPEDVLVTSSAQQALNIVFDVTVTSGRTVLVHEPTFFGTLRILKRRPGVRVKTFSSIDRLIEALETERGAVVYVTSNFASPTGLSLTEKAKTRLAKALERSASIAIEDNPYDLLPFERRPSTLFERVPDRVVFVGGLSKVVGPGVRIGYVFARGETRALLRSAKITADLFTPTLTQDVAARILEDDRHLEQMRTEFRDKREVALAELADAFPVESNVAWESPDGGVFMALRFPRSIDVDHLARVARERHGIDVDVDRFSFADGRSRGIVRINFVQNSIEKLREGIHRLARAYADELRRETAPPEVIVTSGGTRVPIDDVRFIANASGGTTGARIAEEFLKRGWRVHFLRARGSKEPFDDARAVRAEAHDEAAFEAELGRLREVRAEIARSRERLVVHEYVTFDEYAASVERLVRQSDARAIVLAAAVSDYGATAVEGKRSSDAERMDVSLARLPKVIAGVKTWNPNVFQVGFKLLADQDLAEAIDIAYRSGIDNHSNLTVLNVVHQGRLGDRQNVIITPEKGLRGARTEDVATAVAETVIRRTSRAHFRTLSTMDDSFLQKYADEVRAFKAHVRTFWDLDLFEPYYEGASSYFGFFAMRLSEGFLITGRGSDKATMPDEDIVWVRNVDFEHREVHATSTGKKASLNANVAAKIFAERPDVDVILHAHVFPRTDARTTEDFAPSTMEDVDEVMRHLRDGQRTVELVDHGLIAVAKTAKDLTAPFEGQPAYFDFPELYDPIYARFSKSTTFVDLVQKLVAPDAAVLDLAAGTGEVALALGRAGFSDLTLADQSPGMLAVAMDKLERARVRAHFVEGGFSDVDLNRTFDAVVMRQAVTYAKSTDELIALFRHVRAHLRPGGVFVFNAPRFEGQPMAIPDRQSKYNHGDWSVTVHERNTVDETGLLTHAQRATLIGRNGLSFEKVYDLNRFRLYTAAEYQAALMRAGFTIVSVEGVKSKLGPKDKAFYVIAR